MDTPKESAKSASTPLSLLKRRRRTALARSAEDRERGVAQPPATSAGDAKGTTEVHSQPRPWRGPLPLMSASRPIGMATPYTLWEFEKIMFRDKVQPDFDGSEKQVRWARRIFWDRHPGICRYAYQKGGADASIKLRFSYYLAVMNLRYERDATFWIDVETHDVPNEEVVESVRRVEPPPWRR
jgi:hypothetical protein